MAPLSLIRVIWLEDNPVNCEANSRGFEIVAVEITHLISSTNTSTSWLLTFSKFGVKLPVLGAPAGSEETSEEEDTGAEAVPPREMSVFAPQFLVANRNLLKRLAK
ncbi:hypothetical protein CWATWH0402_272 [Crocosphaera watsonii WH 0402]|uniref:Uncharacterized protein n=1 Tax=Crocosphaera watsonii WH 0402 TaxID=1284629 RepID=T2K092_CROWT|nr:hypothetical protein CWATWH0402_272 [Crocosphaera watsonii WH 0402]